MHLSQQLPYDEGKAGTDCSIDTAFQTMLPESPAVC